MPTKTPTQSLALNTYFSRDAAPIAASTHLNGNRFGIVTKDNRFFLFSTSPLRLVGYFDYGKAIGLSTPPRFMVHFDDNVVIVVLKDNTLIAVNFTKNETYQLCQFKDRITALASAPNHTIVVATSRRVRLINPAMNWELNKIEDVFESDRFESVIDGCGVKALSFTEDGKLIYGNSMGDVAVYNLITKKSQIIQTFDESPIVSLACGKDIDKPTLFAMNKGGQLFYTYLERRPGSGSHFRPLGEPLFHDPKGMYLSDFDLFISYGKSSLYVFPMRSPSGPDLDALTLAWGGVRADSMRRNLKDVIITSNTHDIVAITSNHIYVWPLAELYPELTPASERSSRIARTHMASSAAALLRFSGLYPPPAETRSEPRDEARPPRVPQAFLCTLSKEQMTDPVIASDGCSYEKNALRDHLRSSHSPRSPVTGKVLKQQETPNHTLKKIIETYTTHGELEEECEDLLCPIMREKFENPVVCSDGHSYEHAAIIQWFESCRGPSRSPVTNLPLDSEQAVQNRALKQFIESELKNSLDTTTPLVCT